MEGNLIAGFVLIVMGGISVVRPDLILRWRVWMAKKIYGAQYRPSKKTFTIQKIMGAFFVILGLLVITNSI